MWRYLETVQASLLDLDKEVTALTRVVKQLLVHLKDERKKK